MEPLESKSVIMTSMYTNQGDEDGVCSKEAISMNIFSTDYAPSDPSLLLAQ